MENRGIQKDDTGVRIREDVSYWSIFENALTGIAIIDDDTLFIQVNPAFCRLTGYSRDELIGKMKMEDVTHPDDVQDSKRLIQKQIRGETDTFAIEKRYVTKQGHTRHALISVSAVFVKRGEPCGNAVTIMDITERKLAEEKLRLIEFSMESSVFPMIWFDRQGRVVRVNEATCHHLGYTREKLLQMRLRDFDPDFPTDEKWDELWKDIKNRQKHIIRERKHLKKTGEIVQVQVMSTYFSHGGNEYIFSFLQDITEQKQAEEKLRMAEFSIEYSGLPTIWFDRQGRVVRVNEAACQHFGYTRGELMEMSVRDLDTFFKTGKDWDSSWKLMKKRRHYAAVKTQQWKKDGTIIPVEVVSSFFEYEGKEYLYSFFRDITQQINERKEREKLQLQLFQTQKMETLDQLAGGIAHDFNNILTAIVGYSQLLQMTLPADSTAKRYAREILNASKKATSLTQSLLAFTRKQVMHQEPCNLIDIMTNMDKLLRRLIPEDIDFTISLPPAPLTILADMTQIDQVVMNLVTNARDAMPDGGTLKVEVSGAYMDDRFIRANGYGAPGNYALIEVSDTGIGMDSETQKRVFDPFYTTKEVGKGTGLGLSIVYGIIKQYNGHIGVYSEKGSGTTCRIYLPVIDSPPADEKREESGFVGGEETILLAEDDEFVREFTKTTLEGSGYRVILAADGMEAIEKFISHEGKIDLVILDVVMPRKNGREAYDEIAAVDPDVKVLFTSGYTRDILIRKGIEDETYSFIAKPSTPNKLMAKIREILDS